jgi:hypothetical protein
MDVHCRKGSRRNGTRLSNPSYPVIISVQRYLLSPAYYSDSSGLAGCWLVILARPLGGLGAAAHAARSGFLAVLSAAKELRPRLDPSLRSGRPQAAVPVCFGPFRPWLRDSSRAPATRAGMTEATVLQQNRCHYLLQFSIGILGRQPRVLSLAFRIKHLGCSPYA